jgi:hypothetical protein
MLHKLAHVLEKMLHPVLAPVLEKMLHPVLAPVLEKMLHPVLLEKMFAPVLEDLTKDWEKCSLQMIPTLGSGQQRQMQMMVPMTLMIPTSGSGQQRQMQMIVPMTLKEMTLKDFSAPPLFVVKRPLQGR